MTRRNRKETIVAICHCKACGRDSRVEADSVMEIADSAGEVRLSGWFGSAADFCEYCDEMYEGEHVYEIVDKTLDNSEKG